ncbi:hypothetical protein DL240_05315 [Lujinxingia litoralis]|uniref:Uncharacterized protein n=1 Tax=Lujinxingia litoralis TaxID=2211119 RepID=A0A328CAP5_9DELT|nr:hypothetical protein [Lujinxingia litoralis]RAL23579.1 hypothetical protein DL240_05315 [Lujinxingia litoralis]
MSVGNVSYCTSTCAMTASSCAESEVCWQTDGIDFLEAPHCLAGCQQSCDRSDQACLTVRTEINGQIAWRKACVPADLKPIGAKCSTDSECASETCRLDYFTDADDNPVGYCSRECEAGGCPADSACVISSGGAQWCHPRCSSNEICPLDPSNLNLRIGCGDMIIAGEVNPSAVCKDNASNN